MRIIDLGQINLAWWLCFQIFNGIEDILLSLNEKYNEINPLINSTKVHSIIETHGIKNILTKNSRMIPKIILNSRYEQKMKQTEERMRALGLLTPSCVLTLDEWEIPRDRVVINRKLGEGAFGTVYGGEAFFDEKGWVSKRTI